MDNEVGELQFKFHKYQEKALNSNKRFIACLSGIQSGKTFTGCMWLIKEILKGWNEGKDYSYLIAAPTYKILQQSTIRKWLELAPAWLGEYKEQKSVFELKNKGIIYIRSTEDPYGLEGMTLKAAWLDEAGQMPDEVWRVVQGRLAILSGRCIITTTPYIFNWVYKDILQCKDTDKDLEVIQWESKDSPWFPKAEYERQRKLAEGDPNLMAAFEKRYRGMFRSMTGLVFPLWHNKYVQPEVDYRNTTFKEFVGGIDWGFTNPAAIEIIGIKDEKPKFVVVDEWYQQGRVIEEIAAACVQMMQKWNVRLFYADPSRPDYIQELNNRRIPVMIGDNDIQKGVASIQRKIKVEDFGITVKCPNLLEEMKAYHYPETELDGKEEPIAQFNHAIDACRYAIATHFPLELEVVTKESPIWQDIKASLKPIDDADDGMEDVWSD